MAKRSKLNKFGIVAGIVSVVLVLLATLYVLYFGGYLTGGSQSSHVESVNYSNYAWYLMLPLLFVVLAVIASIALLTRVSFKGKSGKTRKTLAIVISLLTVGGAVIVAFFGGFYVRAYSDTAEVSDIKLQTDAAAGAAEIDLGNYTVLSASVEEYHTKDKSHYDDYRLLTFDDKWRVAVRVNNTAFWNATNQNLTGVTATLQGYGMPSVGTSVYTTVSGLYAPNTQIGATTYADVDVLVFEGVTRDPRIVSFELKILDADGGELGVAYIHPAVELSETAWFMNTDLA